LTKHFFNRYFIFQLLEIKNESIKFWKYVKSFINYHILTAKPFLSKSEILVLFAKSRVSQIIFATTVRVRTAKGPEAINY
jgi:hypothetical protein